WEVEDLGRGQWQVVVTEIPYQVQKSKLIEKIAELIQTKKVPILADVRDESADDVRMILEPRSKNVDPEVMMGMLYRNSDLEVRFSLNMNVLVDGVTPKVCSLKEVLRAFLDFRREVLIRRSRHRMAKIDHRLEVLQGLITAFLNLDRVIEIIRYDDDPKAALMYEDWSHVHQSTLTRAMDEGEYRSPLEDVDVKALSLVADPDMDATGVLSESAPERAVPHSYAGRENGLSDVQAEAILNMRLRSLRRLEEEALVKERDALMEERAELEDLLDDETLQWGKIADQLREVKKTFGKDYVLDGQNVGARRTQFSEAGEVEEVPLEAMIDREPITVVCSKMGWIRAMSGHIDLSRELKFKDGDEGRFIFHAETTDRLLVFGSNGRFYTLSAANLPGGRGMGEPLRLMVDLPNEAEIVDLFIHKPGRKLLVASSAGDGFVVGEDDVVAQTRSGKQVLNVRGDSSARVCTPVNGDHVACVGENRKVLIFPVEELPEMGRGKGVRLQKYKDGGLSDAATFTLADGLSWHDPAGRTRTETELAEWIGKRAGTGRMAPRGFPRDNRFT
ncbi:MAG TPA: DNA gyrase subunit A, partial [Roseovarius sp.]|nr:DNA gyrase subunit A [Roseovarius sp.]